MKKILLASILLTLISCSSKPKTEEAPPEASTPESVSVQEEPAAPATPEPVAPKEKVAPVESPADTGGGSFPDVEGPERSSAECNHGNEARRIAVIDTAEKHCGVVYTRGGVKKTVAYARNSMAYCDTVLEKIKGNLAAAGFSCGGEAPAAKAEAAPAPEQKQEQPQGN